MIILFVVYSKLSCSVKAYSIEDGPSGPTSGLSTPMFVGIMVKQPNYFIYISSDVCLFSYDN